MKGIGVHWSVLVLSIVVWIFKDLYSALFVFIIIYGSFGLYWIDDKFCNWVSKKDGKK